MCRPCCQCKKCAVVDRLARAQPRVERRDAALRLDSKRRREIELIHVAGADPFMDCGDALRVFGFGEGELGCQVLRG